MQPNHNNMQQPPYNNTHPRAPTLLGEPPGGNANISNASTVRDGYPQKPTTGATVTAVQLARWGAHAMVGVRIVSTRIASLLHNRYIDGAYQNDALCNRMLLRSARLNRTHSFAYGNSWLRTASSSIGAPPGCSLMAREPYSRLQRGYYRHAHAGDRPPPLGGTYYVSLQRRYR